MTTLLTFVNHLTRMGIRHSGTARRAAIFLAAALMANVLPLSAGELAAPAPRGGVSAANPHAGVFTGEFVNGLPVYRLPPITITASRDAELARMRREESAARARQARDNRAVTLHPTTADKAAIAPGTP